MENSPRYIIVGVFMIAMIGALFGIVYWFMTYQHEASRVLYVTYLTEDVTGLDVGSTVRYRGVPVGRVSSISIDPGDVERTKVVVELAAVTPVKQDTVAEIATLGVTGVTFIQLTGGTRDAPALVRGPDQLLPVIPSRPSALQLVVTSLPALLERAMDITERVTRLMSDKNLASVERTVESLTAFGQSLNTINGNVLDPLASKTTATLDQVARAAKALEAVAMELNGVIEENREPLQSFSQSGLTEYRQLAAESRVLVDSLIRLTQQIERNPAQFFFGDSQRGYQPR
jgi:phospholipid/cholesterol/gamma-HCH transport system substrate-binding protein